MKSTVCSKHGSIWPAVEQITNIVSYEWHSIPAFAKIGITYELTSIKQQRTLWHDYRCSIGCKVSMWKEVNIRMSELHKIEGRSCCSIWCIIEWHTVKP